jgi:lipopolysaccharide transport system ATP-binding protein
MDDDILVRAESVSKKYCRDLKKSLWYGVKDTVADFLGRDSAKRELRKDEFWALDDVSFQLRRGEFLGLIGRNGAGKTTLLKMLSGLIKPDGGRIEMRGRVGAMIALGAGFNPLLTGRENIYVNASILGLTTREIGAKIDSIIDFAEIGPFIDSPVQSYSSGMAVRLGFAIAVATEPDILLLDEILAVGDVGFQAKCFNALTDFKRQGTCFVFVSHNMQTISRFCQRVMYLRQGRVQHSGDVATGIAHFYKDMEANDSAGQTGLLFCEPGFELVQASLSADEVAWGDQARANIEFISPDHFSNAEARVTFMDENDVVLAEWRSSNNNLAFEISKGRNTLSFELGPLMLRAGTYFVSFILSHAATAEYMILSFKQRKLLLTGGARGFSAYQLKHS